MKENKDVTSQEVVFSPELVEEVGKMEKVMEAFLDRQINEIQDQINSKFPNASPGFTMRVLECFVNENGESMPLNTAQIQNRIKDLPTLEFCVNALIQARILRKRGSVYELGQSILADFISRWRTSEEVYLQLVKKLLSSRYYASSKNNVYLGQEELNFISKFESRLIEGKYLSVGEQKFLEKSKQIASRQKKNINIIIGSVLGTLALILCFALWQMFESTNRLNSNIKYQFDQFLVRGENAESESDYKTALIVYEEALGLLERNKDIITEDLNDALSLKLQAVKQKLDLEAEYKELLAKGDGLKEKGNSALIDAIEKYEQARSLDYNNKEVEKRIQEVNSEALPKAQVSLEFAGDKFKEAGICNEAKLRYSEVLNIIQYLYHQHLLEKNTFEQSSERITKKIDSCK